MKSSFSRPPIPTIFPNSYPILQTTPFDHNSKHIVPKYLGTSYRDSRILASELFPSPGLHNLLTWHCDPIGALVSSRHVHSEVHSFTTPLCEDVAIKQPSGDLHKHVRRSGWAWNCISLFFLDKSHLITDGPMGMSYQYSVLLSWWPDVGEGGVNEEGKRWTVQPEVCLAEATPHDWRISKDMEIKFFCCCCFFRGRSKSLIIAGRAIDRARLVLDRYVAKPTTLFHIRYSQAKQGKGSLPRTSAKQTLRILLYW